MIRGLFLSTLKNSFLVSIVVLVLLALAPLLNRRYAAKWKYWLWIALAFQLLIPLGWKAPYQQLVIPIPLQAPFPAANHMDDTGIPLALQARHPQTGISPLHLAATVWMIGFFIFLAVHLFCYLHYKRQIINHGIPMKNSYVLKQLSTLPIAVKHKLTAIMSPKATSPMVIGIFHPTLVFPKNEYNDEELFFILKHELIHLKRHDIYYKLLFLTATAVHWFNPIIHLMQKEAAIDMELSCDEKVIQGTTYETKKAYTETLLSTLHKQYKKKSILSTQFYGGKNIMKKRLKNILIKNTKKNGLFLLAGVLGLTLASGTLIGCTITEQASAGQSSSMTLNKSDNKLPSSPMESYPADSPKPDNTENQRGNLSADGQKIKSIVEAFAKAYFNGNKKGIKKYLTVPYDSDITVYTGTADAVSNISMKGLTEIGEHGIGDTCSVSIEFKCDAKSDSFLYLTIILVKQEDDWKIQFYGLER